MSAMRHKDVEICMQNALTQYLFYRYHIKEETWPDFSSPEKWSRNKLLIGDLKFPYKSLNETTQRKWIRRVFNEVKIQNEKVLHSGRKKGAHLTDVAGVKTDEVRFYPLAEF